MKKINPTVLTACLAGALLTGLFARAADVTWTGLGGDNDWQNAANWSTDPSLPVEGTGSSGDVLLLDATGNHAIYTEAEGTRFYRAVRVGYNADGRLDVTGGLLIHDDSIQARIGRGNGRTGTLNVSGGELRLSAARTQIGLDSGSTGIVNLTGGTLTFGRESAGVSGELGANGNGTINISGGIFQTRAGMILGTATTGVGLFNVQGGGATSIGIGSFGSLNGNWLQNAGSTLRVGIDAGGVTPTTIADTGGASATFATFESGSLLDVGFLGAPTGGTWTVMEVENGLITDNGLVFAPGVDTDVWSFLIDNTGPNGILSVSAVPEPGTWALAGLGLLGLIASRRIRA